MERSFHGRTFAGISATGQAKFREGFEPVVPGFVHVPFNDLAAVERALTPKTAAIILEPIQGEGGVRVADAAYLAGLKRLCQSKKILLIFDEVQTGMGRTGRMFAFKNFGIEPDVMTLAKSLGGGFPIGATVANLTSQSTTLTMPAVNTTVLSKFFRNVPFAFFRNVPL